MQKSLKFIIWGIIITTVDFWVGLINIIPSAVGYLFITIGVLQIVEVTHNKNLNRLSKLLMGMTFVSIFTGDLMMIPFSISTSSALFISVSAGFTILNMIVYYIILRELILISSKDKMMKQFRIYTILSLIITLLTVTYTLLGINSFELLIIISAIMMKLYTAYYITYFIDDIAVDEKVTVSGV